MEALIDVSGGRAGWRTGGGEEEGKMRRTRRDVKLTGKGEEGGVP